MMQYDVKSSIVKSSSQVTADGVRLKGITVSSATASARNIAVCDPTVSKSGTYTRTSPSSIATITITNHGLNTGDRVFLDATSGTMRDGVYTITKTGANTFTVDSIVTTSTSGNVTMYTSIALELDTYNVIPLPVLIPGEGIRMPNGMFVGVGASVTATVIYG